MCRQYIIGVAMSLSFASAGGLCVDPVSVDSLSGSGDVAIKNDVVQDVATAADSIRMALEYQRINYPASQYRDVYKNFMQDFFGPGHILKNKEGAERYLKSELAETEEFGGPLYEPTGFRSNFYRVNIGLVKDGTIPYDIFFDTFVRSISGIVPPDPDYWRGIWRQVDEVISEMGWHFNNELQDREALAAQFAQGNYIAHHSEAYNRAVKFHYRIISRELFEEILRPYLAASPQ